MFAASSIQINSSNQNMYEGPSIDLNSDALSDKSFHISARPYQLEIYRLIEEQWSKEKACGFGSIVFMATGSGKTFVAIMLILKIFGMDPYKLVRKTDKQLMAKREFFQQNDFGGRKVAFLVPTTNLVE